MKNKNIFLLSTVLLVLCLGFGACDEEEYPCDPPIMDFKMEQQNSFWPDSLLECTKCIEDGYIKFSVLDTTVEVIRWQVGNDPREFTEPSFSLFFQDAVGKSVPVTLHFEKRLDAAQCETTYYRDSITKIVEFVSYFESKVFGKYKGYNTDEPDKEFVIEVIDSVFISNQSEAYNCIPFVEPPIIYKIMRGLPSTCNNMQYICHYPRFTPSYDKFYFEMRPLTDECLAVHGRAELSEDYNKITIGYKTFDKYEGIERFEKQRTFVGYRIN